MRARKAVAALVGWLVLCYGAAAVGAQFLPGPWYAQLAKPAWTPPAWLFAPVWTVLYGMMAVAAWLIWREWRERGFGEAGPALLLFVVQLGLNSAWSGLFFGLRRPGLALVDIVALWVAIGITVIAFWRVRRAAALLLVPYLLWVTFAAALNFAIWRMNA